MKRRSFLSLAFASIIPTILLTAEPAEAASTVNISTNVEDDYAPYVVDCIIKNEKTGAVTTTHDVVKSGTFNKIFTHKSGQNITFVFSVVTSRAGSKSGYLQINDRVALINGGQGVLVINYKATA